MKRFIWILVGTAAVIAFGFIIAGTGNRATSADQTTDTASAVEAQTSVSTVTSFPTLNAKQIAAAPTSNEPQSRVETSRTKPPVIPEKTPVTDLVLDQAVATVLSAQTTFDQKQAAWKQLRKAGKLDIAISELEQRVAANPQSAETITALGQAYYKKAGDTEDVRESAILAMKADKALEAALNLDPSNWDARYMRAAGMAYWPPELNKTKEVIEQFQSLIQDQESQAPQPHFARSYLKLGEVYEKAGYAKYANDVWQRGAAMFPTDQDLKEKLTAAR